MKVFIIETLRVFGLLLLGGVIYVGIALIIGIFSPYVLKILNDMLHTNYVFITLTIYFIISIITGIVKAKKIKKK